MSDILLVIPPPFLPKMPHIGVAYLSGFLTQKGYEVSICDLSARLYNRAPVELKRFWQADCCNSFFVSEIADKIFAGFKNEINGFVEEFLGTYTKIVGFSVNIASIYLANEIARLIKEKDPQRLVVFGGAGTYFKHPRELIKPAFADIYVIGEGEQALAGIMESYYAGRKIESGPGILLGKDSGAFRVTPAPGIADLDGLPFPTFLGFDLAEYNQPDTYQPLPLLLSRGCIRRCSYCVDCVMWPQYRRRSPRLIMDEIRYQVLENKAKAFEFNDLTCNGDLRQLSELCDLIIDSGLKFDWVSYAFVRKDMGLALLSKMKQAGCHTIIYGVESGSERVLKMMGKPYTAEDASEVIRLTRKSGICTNVNIIVGFPGETEEDFSQTKEFIRRNKDYIDEITNVSACTLFPEAAIGRNKDKYGIVWEEGTDPMLFSDSNGLSRKGREERVIEMTRLIDSLGLAKSIINKPILNPEVVAALKKERKFQRIASGVTILLLFIFTIFIEFYHSSLKRFRGWTLFLGG